MDCSALVRYVAAQRTAFKRAATRGALCAAALGALLMGLAAAQMAAPTAAPAAYSTQTRSANPHVMTDPPAQPVIRKVAAQAQTHLYSQAAGRTSGIAFAGEPQLAVKADGRIRLELELSEALEHSVMSLTDPDRLVIDFPEIAWRITAAQAKGLRARGVRGVRFGLHRVGRSRMVIDLDGAPFIMHHGALPQTATRPARFIIEFFVRDAAEQPYAEIETRPKPAIATVSSASAFAPRRAPRPETRPRKLVIALDPGHGGVDPGASYGGVDEKTFTLTFARQAKAAIERGGLLSVVLTRNRDETVSLDERVARARAAGADLFLSIHADALPNRPDVSGASVYTLSDSASDSLAATLARRENAADAIAGLSLAAEQDDIREILVDLARQQTLVDSDRVAGLLIEELRERVPVLPSRPHRYAPFAVLKSFDRPAALIELGFLTNLRDRRRLTNPAWREKAAEALALAVRRWAMADVRYAMSRR